MANYNELITAMEAVIKENGNEEITGVILQNTLRAMIQVLGAECQFAGVATPQTVPGTPDYRVAYILGAGIYPNFNGASVQNGNIAIASNTGIGGAWSVEQIALIPDGTIVTAMIADDAITEDKIENNAVTESKINNNAVTESKINNGAVTENKINNNAVTENKINNNAVTENKIANNAVTENKIADDAVTTNKIKNKNVTREKLSDELKDELDNKANIDGFYSTLGAGVAENLVGRGSVPAEYTFRTSGGDADLGSGTAQIKRLMGRTLVWNNLIINTLSSGTESQYDTDLSFTASDDGHTLIVNGTAPSTKGYSKKITGVFQQISGHKYLTIIHTNNPNLGVAGRRSAGWFALNNGQIAVATSSALQDLAIMTQENAVFDNVKVTPIIVDLTLMFGVGNEPSTVAEFKSLFPLEHYAYNPGTLLSVNATGIKTIGFNQWDEQWEVGYVNPSTGANQYAADAIRSKNYIPVFPNTNYYIKTPYAVDAQRPVMSFYDSNKVYISGNTSSGNSRLFTTPTNAAYMRFALGSITPVYNNDICINLSWSGYRNGEYEPYWESELPIPITTMTGKLNGAGASIAMFADGFKNAGSAFDEITPEKAAKRIGKANAKSLTGWSYARNEPTVAYFSAPILGMKSGMERNIVWVNSSPVSGWPDVEGIREANGRINIAVLKSKLSSVDLTGFMAWLNSLADATIYFELATPEEYILDAEQPMNYRVDDFGTEMELPQNGDEPVTAPIRYDVQYAMNAVDTLRRLPENYISKESFADFLAEFDSKVGAAINATIVSTMTFNAETQKYGFNITITPNNP